MTAMLMLMMKVHDHDSSENIDTGLEPQKVSAHAAITF